MTVQQPNLYPLKFVRTPQSIMSLGHTSVAMSNLCLLTTRSTIQRTGSVVFSATDYLTHLSHSPLVAESLAIQLIQQYSMAMAMDIEPTPADGFRLHSSRPAEYKEYGSRYNGTLLWIMDQERCRVVTKRLFGITSQRPTM